MKSLVSLRVVDLLEIVERGLALVGQALLILGFGPFERGKVGDLALLVAEGLRSSGVPA